MTSCLNNSDGSCLNGGQCVSNNCVCSSPCYIGSYCETPYNGIDLPFATAILQDVPSTRVIYIVTITVFVAIGLVNNTVALMTFTRECIRITACGVYLIVFSSCTLLFMICLELTILALAEPENESYRSWSCYGIPYVSLSMGYTSVWASVGISVERVLIECFNLNIFGSRLRAWLTSLGFCLFAAVSNLPAIFARRYSVGPSGQLMCIYDYISNPVWNCADKIFSYMNVVIPCVVHLICSVCILTTIVRRKILIGRGSQRLSHVWLRQLYIHRDFFIPPVCIITCLLPNAIYGHLLDICVSYSSLGYLRLHIALTLLLPTPSMLIYIVYIYPSEIYTKEFRQTWIYRTLCCCLDRKGKDELQKRYQRPLAKLPAQEMIDNSHSFNRSFTMTIDHLDQSNALIGGKCESKVTIMTRFCLLLATCQFLD